MQDQQLDKLVNSLIDASEFRAETADWNRFEQLLDDGAAKKKSPFWWILNSILLLLIASGGYAYYQFKQTNNLKQFTQKQTATTPAIVKELPTVNSTQINKNNTTVTNNINTTSNVGLIANDGVETITKQVTEQNKQTLVKQNQINTPQANNSSDDKRTLANATSYILPNMQSKTTHQFSTVQIKTPSAQKRLNSLIDKTTLPKQVIEANEQTNNEPNHDESSSEKIVAQKENTISKKVQTSTNDVENKNTTNKVIQEDTAMEKKDTDVSLEKENIDNKRDYYSNSFEPVWEWFVQGGTALNKGLQGNYSSKKDWTVAPYFGVQINRQFTKHIGINTGLEYSYNNALNTQYKKYFSKYYFGRDTTAFTIQYNKYHYVQLPIQIKYAINKSIYTQIGASAIYMIDMHSNLYDKYYGARTEYGFGTGFNRLDATANATFGIHISPRFIVEAKYQYGFTDLTKNNYFTNTIIDKQQQLKVGLSYLLNNKRY